MASYKQLKAKDGRTFFEFNVYRGAGKPRLTERWYPEDNWYGLTQKNKQRAVDRAAEEFERKVMAGEILSKAEQKELDKQRAAEEAKILTLRQYGEKVFMPAKAVTMGENSRSTYQGYLNKRIYPILGETKMPEITPAQISALLLDMQSDGMAHATVIKVYTILSGLFKMAYLGDAIERNPMDKVIRPKPRKEETKSEETKALLPEDVTKLLSALEDEPLKWRAYIHLLIDTGVRRGEACAIQWESVNMKTGAVTISHNLCYTAEKGVFMSTPKNGKTRTVYISQETIALLRQLREEQSEKCISRYVFTQEESSEPIHPTSPTHYFRRLSEKTGIADLHPHLLRHTFASLAITSGADVASVSEVLGHSDKAVTLRMYTHANEESKKKAASIVQEAIKKAASQG